MIKNIVSRDNLGDDFDIGVEEVSKIHVKVDNATIVRDALTGVLSADTPTNNFWRSGAGGTDVADGVNDNTEDIRRDGNVGINVDPVAALDVNGAEVLRDVTVTLTADGVVGTAAATVDITSTLNVDTALPNGVFTLPTPTNITAGRRLTVYNKTANSFSVDGVSINPGELALFQWDGTQWSKATGLASIEVNYWETVTAAAAPVTTTVSLPHNETGQRPFGNAWLQDGKLWAHGFEVYGTAGATNGLDGNRTPTTIPGSAIRTDTTPVGRIPNFVRFWSSRYGLLLLDDLGKLWYRGWNSARQSGMPTRGAGEIIEIPYLIDYFEDNNITIVDAYLADSGIADNDEYSSIYAITDTGELYVWGRNANGQLGIGNTTDQATPQLVGGALTGKTVVQVKALTNYCAFVLTSDGELYAAGRQTTGAFGIGNTTQQTSWVLAKTGIANWFMAEDASFVIDTSGQVWSAGNNASGWFGLGNNTSSTSWVMSTSFTGVANEIVAIQDTYQTMYIIDSLNNLWVAGNNTYAQLGLGGGSTAAQNNHLLLTAVQAPFQGKVKEVHSAGHATPTVYVVTTDGEIWSVGYNAYGQRGLGNRIDSAIYRSTWLPSAVVAPVVTARSTGHDNSATLEFVDVNGSVYFTGGWDNLQVNPLASWSSAPYRLN